MRCWSPIALVFIATLAVSQQSADRSPFSSDLVLWSHMQQPQQPEQGQPRQTPTPDPTPETQPAQNPTPAQPSQQKSAGSQGQASAAQTFTGVINKQADGFLLKISETISYKLDNQTEVQQYEGKRVRITGTLDTSVNLIHVEKVEPLM
jgi:hypothetical protein